MWSKIMPRLQRPERLALTLLIVVALLTLVQGCASTAQPAPELRLVAALDLSQGPFNQLVLARLRLNDTVVLRLYLRLSQLDTPSFDLSLRDAAQVRYRIIQAEDYRTARDGDGTWEQQLPAGDYQLMLSAAASPGTLEVLVGQEPEVQLIDSLTAYPVFLALR